MRRSTGSSNACSRSRSSTLSSTIVNTSKLRTRISGPWHPPRPNLAKVQHAPCLTVYAAPPLQQPDAWKHTSHLSRSTKTPAAKRRQPGPLDSDGDRSLLLLEGFTEVQAERLLTYIVSLRQRLNIDNVRQWLQLLRKHHVLHPVAVMCRRPILIRSLAVNSAANAALIVQWLFSTGLTQAGVSQLVADQPMMLIVSRDNVAAVEAWLRTDLEWSSDMIAKALQKDSGPFMLRPSNLLPKLAWYKAAGFSDADASKLFSKHPRLLMYALERNKAQLSALQATGLSHPQVNALILRMPKIMDAKMESIQAKVQFLTQVMGRSIVEVLVCPAFFTYSLRERTSPRWAFHTLHGCSHPFVLGTALHYTDDRFAEIMSSSSASLVAECKSRGLTPFELYSEFMVQHKLKGGV